MERNVIRKCGFYDAEIHTEKYSYDTKDACNGMKMIINGFSTWVDNHLGNCNGQRKNNHQGDFQIDARKLHFY